ILYHLRRFHPDAEVTCICTGPEATVATYQIEAIPISETLVESRLRRNPFVKVVRRVCIGIPSELYRWAKGLMPIRASQDAIQRYGGRVCSEVREVYAELLHR